MTNPLVVNFVRRRSKRVAEELSKHSLSDIRQFLDTLDETDATMVASRLPSNTLSRIMAYSKPSRLAGWIIGASLADASILIAHLPANRYQLLLDAAPAERRGRLQRRLGVAGQTVGTLTTSDFISVAPEQRCSDVLALMTQADLTQDQPLIVIRDDATYVGMVPVHVLMAERNAGRPVADFVQTVQPIASSASIDSVLALEEWFDFTVLPVTDAQHRFSGTVSLRDLRRASQQKTSQGSASPALPLIDSVFELYARALDMLLSWSRP
jgi:Mg/Co/Ni transporter MgtE